MFENTGRDEFLPNLSRGRLNTAALHTLAAGNDKVFKRRREIAGIDSAVCVLIDVSGSMRRAQTQVAVSTAYALLESLEQAGVKTSVLTFGSRVAVLKPFESRSIKRHRDLLRSLGDGGGTNDYYAVRIAHEMLSKQDAQRKVVFVLTDGMGDMDSTKAQIKSGEALGITTVGVGICEDVSFVYAKSVTVNDLTEVAHTSFRQIKLAA
jgi:cobalamin biosynthesis protein CobT